MKLKSIPLLLLLPTLMLLVAGCEGPGSALEKRIVGSPTARLIRGFACEDIRPTC